MFSTLKVLRKGKNDEEHDFSCLIYHKKILETPIFKLFNFFYRRGETCINFISIFHFLFFLVLLFISSPSFSLKFPRSKHRGSFLLLVQSYLKESYSSNSNTLFWYGTLVRPIKYMI